MEMLSAPPSFNQTQVWHMSVLKHHNNELICYAPTMISTSGVWNGSDPLISSFPTFILQLMVIAITTRMLIFILQPLRQPRVVAQILAGMLLGPWALGRIEIFATKVFPLRSYMILETMANIGLQYFLFLVGLEMDLNIIKRTGQKTWIIAITGMACSFSLSILVSSFSMYFLMEMEPSKKLLLFIGISHSVTAFSVITRILGEVKLLNNEVGKICMSASVISDMLSWILLAVATIVGAHKKTSVLFNLESTQVPHIWWGILYAGIFVLVSVFVFRPAIIWLIKRTPEEESFNDFYICLILAGVTICGFITDMIGTHSVFGAFVFGLIIPNGPLGITLMEKLEDFITGLLLPLFFATIGLRTDVLLLKSFPVIFTLTFSSFICSVGKMIGIYVVSHLHDMRCRDGWSIGLLMNARGLMEIVMLKVYTDQVELPDQDFTVLVIISVVTTSMITPILLAINKPSKVLVTHKHRTIQAVKMDVELRMLVCVHTPRNVPTIINILEASHPTKKSPICIYTLHLVELTVRGASMLIVHNVQNYGKPATKRTRAQSEHIVSAFENYAEQKENVIVQPLTTISPYSTMHEDIRNLAEEKQVTMIIIPFHKQQTVDGGMEPTNPAYRLVNQNLLENIPCSIGILIDRGFGGTVHVQGNHILHNIIMLFFGGPDDREALAYAKRMAEHPGVNLTVVRFCLRGDVVEPNANPNNEDHITVITNYEQEKQLDDEYINEFKQAILGNGKIEYKEKVVSDAEETVSTIGSMDGSHDLCIVGRGHNIRSPLTAGLNDWSECPELGVIGDLLASSDVTIMMSVLVVQQYIGAEMHEETTRMFDSPTDSSKPLQNQLLEAK